jgi:hypothetical protein
LLVEVGFGFSFGIDAPINKSRTSAGSAACDLALARVVLEVVCGIDEFNFFLIIPMRSRAYFAVLKQGPA